MEVSGVTLVESGSPFSITNSQSDIDHDGNAGSPGTGGRSDVVYGVFPQVMPGPNSSKLTDYLNPAAFSSRTRDALWHARAQYAARARVNLWDARILRSRSCTKP